MSAATTEGLPPAAETTAADPQKVARRPALGPERPELTPARGDGLDPEPRTLGTQEIRLALAFTGGVSLAVWMGGVARELDLLVQASHNRRVLHQDPVDPSTPDANPVRRAYRRLLDLIDAEVAIDALAGTSAGGINAALLGLVNAWGADLGKLRDTWLDTGDFSQLLRDPAEQKPPSLLKGDEQMLAALNKAVDDLVKGSTPPVHPRYTDVFITTTYLSAETSRYTDDYATQIADSDHHGLFHFDEKALLEPGTGAALALAARSSASFPGAFEPSFVPFGGDGKAGSTHPDMARWSNATRSHWAADGGLLANRPIAPLLQTVFDRPADRQVRRALLYVVPSSRAPQPDGGDEQARPLSLPVALLRDLGATLNQSIAADLAAIKEHNDRVRASADTRLRMAQLGTRLRAGRPSDGQPRVERPLADAEAWRDFTVRQGQWLVRPLVRELTRQLTALGTEAPWKWQDTGDEALRDTACKTITEHWAAPASDAKAVDAAVELGRAAYDSARALATRLVSQAFVLARTSHDRTRLAGLGMKVTRALDTSRRVDLQLLVKEELHQACAATPRPTLDAVVRELAATYSGAVGAPLRAPGRRVPDQGVSDEDLRKGWKALVGAFRQLQATLPDLVDRAAADPRSSERCRLAAEEIRSYLDFLSEPPLPARLLDLHVAVRSVLPVVVEVDQVVELIQVSADTGTDLAPEMKAAEQKLTGMQLQHFGAFYKDSWRASDWMWGRLDGCGWLVHLLLDPRRMRAVAENKGFERRADAFAARLEAAVERKLPADRRADLAFLDDDTKEPPASLPDLARWVAAGMQARIAADELPFMAERLLHAVDKPSAAESGWVRTVQGTDWTTADPSVVGRVLADCPIPAQTLQGEMSRRSPLFLRTATHAAAVGTAAATSAGKVPTALRPTVAGLRTVTRGAFTAVRTTHGVHGRSMLLGAGLLALGVLAMLTTVGWLQAGGTGAFAVGAVLLALVLGGRLVSAGRYVVFFAVLLIAFSPFSRWVRDHAFGWIRGTALPWVADHAVPWLESHVWVWALVVLFVLLPLLVAADDVARGVARGLRRRPRRRPVPVGLPGSRAGGAPAEGAVGGPAVREMTREQHGALARIPRPRGRLRSRSGSGSSR